MKRRWKIERNKYRDGNSSIVAECKSVRITKASIGHYRSDCFSQSKSSSANTPLVALAILVHNMKAEKARIEKFIAEAEAILKDNDEPNFNRKDINTNEIPF